MIQQCSSFTFQTSASSGSAMDATQVVRGAGSKVLVSSFQAGFFYRNFDREIPSYPISNVPRVHFLDADDNVLFAVVPFFNMANRGLSNASAVPNSMDFKIPGPGLYSDNCLKINALAPAAAPADAGKRLTVNLVYQA